MQVNTRFELMTSMEVGLEVVGCFQVFENHLLARFYSLYPITPWSIINNIFQFFIPEYPANTP